MCVYAQGSAHKASIAAQLAHKPLWLPAKPLAPGRGGHAASHATHAAPRPLSALQLHDACEDTGGGGGGSGLRVSHWGTARRAMCEAYVESVTQGVPLYESWLNHREHAALRAEQRAAAAATAEHSTEPEDSQLLS